MSGTPPGPLCVTRLGTDWIDQETMSRSRSPSPGPLCEVLLPGSDKSYPKQTADLAAWLIRQGYIQRLSSMLPAAWTSMSEQELTRNGQAQSRPFAGAIVAGHPIADL